MRDEQLLRYSRHILLPEFGLEAQERLGASHALVIGAGGLGSPVALFLAASGIGKLTICDSDSVDLTNLQRQILHDADSLGELKVDSAVRRLAKVNPEVSVMPLPLRVGETELDGLVTQADVILDCSDNFATRYLLNRLSLRHRKPLVSGAAVRFDGQLSVYDPTSADSPCYQCLYPEAAESEEVRCAVMGVYAPLVGIIGSMQAAEALKVLTRIGEPLVGRLFLYDALHAQSRTLTLPRDPHCPECGRAR